MGEHTLALTRGGITSRSSGPGGRRGPLDSRSGRAPAQPLNVGPLAEESLIRPTRQDRETAIELGPSARREVLANSRRPPSPSISIFWIPDVDRSMAEFEACRPGVVLDFNRDIRRWGRDSESVQAS
jgi:hypothetical protein